MSLHANAHYVFDLARLHLLFDLGLLFVILQPSDAVLKHSQLELSLLLFAEGLKHHSSFRSHTHSMEGGGLGAAAV